MAIAATHLIVSIVWSLIASPVGADAVRELVSAVIIADHPRVRSAILVSVGAGVGRGFAGGADRS